MPRLRWARCRAQASGDLGLNLEVASVIRAKGFIGVSSLTDVAKARLRNSLRRMEFTLHPAAQSAILRIASPVENPYTPGNDRLKAIFIHIPKTAGTSVADSVFGTSSFHIPLTRYYLYDPQRFRDYFKFCFVRNPYDRARSAFYHLRTYANRASTPDTLWARDHLRSDMTFPEFVFRMQFAWFRRRALNQTHFRPQHQWINIPSVGLCVDKVYRFECMAEALEDLSKRLGVPIPPSKLRSGYTPAGEGDCYTAEMRKTIACAYSQDFRYFDYQV